MIKFLAAISLVIGILPLVFFGCQSEERGLLDSKVKMALTSSAFSDGDAIPTKYTCDGENISPILEWNDPPPQTVSLAIIMDDPDAPGKVFTHWLVFNLPSDMRKLVEAIPVGQELEGGVLQGKNDFGTNGYGGPCPPSGKTHRYRFTIYALDSMLDIEAGIEKDGLLDAINSHIIAYGQLTASYIR